MSIICTICARGGSKGLRLKTLKKINGKPLITYTIKQAIKSKIFDKVVVSTDSKEIRKVALKSGAESWFLRPKKLSSDVTSKLSAIKHVFLESEKHFGKKFDICVDLDVTSPLRKISDIKKALRKFQINKSSNLFSVCHAKKNPYFNMVERLGNKIKVVKNKKKFPSNKIWMNAAQQIHRRQDAPVVYEINASIYIWKREMLLKSDSLFFKNTSIYVMPQRRSIDIDNLSDFKIVESLMKYDKKLFKSF